MKKKRRDEAESAYPLDLHASSRLSYIGQAEVAHPSEDFSSNLSGKTSSEADTRTFHLGRDAALLTWQS